LDYRHTIDKVPSSLPVGKVVCVGRNYAAHARELNNPVPDEPVLFIKPQSAVVSLHQPIALPSYGGNCHFELELALLFSQSLGRGCSQSQALAAIAGIGLALDLTLRDLQQQLKQSGLPWEKSKAFDGACPLSEFVGLDRAGDLQQQRLKLWRNGELCQDGHSSEMLVPVVPLVTYVTQFFSLQPGDVLLTGTPAGVGSLQSGDQLQLALSELIETTVEVL
jgi:2-keto-4-pentenoate hydratase/2-oxohepta-3-ene-1,7-dioic acid hydratase in catechol pathway